MAKNFLFSVAFLILAFITHNASSAPTPTPVPPIAHAPQATPAPKYSPNLAVYCETSKSNESDCEEGSKKRLESYGGCKDVKLISGCERVGNYWQCVYSSSTCFNPWGSRHINGVAVTSCDHYDILTKKGIEQAFPLSFSFGDAPLHPSVDGAHNMLCVHVPGKRVRKPSQNKPSPNELERSQDGPIGKPAE